jgi:hypothetical protein
MAGFATKPERGGGGLRPRVGLCLAPTVEPILPKNKHVKLVFLSSADADTVRQFSWYLEHGSLDVVRRFRTSVERSVALAYQFHAQPFGRETRE